MEALAHTDRPAMTVEEFEAWSLDREGRWELMSGIPVRMQSESRLHSRASRRIAVFLEGLLDGHPCTPDERIDVVCGEADIRQADVLIDCHPDAAVTASTRALRPVVVFEVAVISQAYDLGGKHMMYFHHPDVQHYVVVMPAEQRVVHLRRDAPPRVLAPGETLDLAPEPGIAVPVAGMLG